MTLSVLKRISATPIQIRSVTAANILILKRVRFILGQGITIRLLAGLFHGILLRVKMKIRLASICILIVAIILYFMLIRVGILNVQNG